MDGSKEYYFCVCVIDALLDDREDAQRAGLTDLLILSEAVAAGEDSDFDDYQDQVDWSFGRNTSQSLMNCIEILFTAADNEPEVLQQVLDVWASEV